MQIQAYLVNLITVIKGGVERDFRVLDLLSIKFWRQQSLPSEMSALGSPREDQQRPGGRCGNTASPFAGTPVTPSLHGGLRPESHNSPKCHQ